MKLISVVILVLLLSACSMVQLVPSVSLAPLPITRVEYHTPIATHQAIARPVRSPSATTTPPLTCQPVGYLNLRADLSIHARVIAILSPDDLVTVRGSETGELGDWLKVDTTAGPGWINAAYCPFPHPTILEAK